MLRDIFSKNRTMSARGAAAVVFFSSLVIVFAFTVIDGSFSLTESVSIAVVASTILALAAYARAKVHIK